MLVATIIFENFSCGLSQVALICYMTNLSRKMAPWSMAVFALFTSLASFDRVIISMLSGVMADVLPWASFFLCGCLFSIPAVYILMKRISHFDIEELKPTKLAL